FSLAQEAQNIRRVANLKAKSFCRNRSLQAGSPSNFLKQQKLSKKETPHTHHGVAVGALLRLCGRFRRLRAATNAPRVGWAQAFEKA
ncbi:MAG: hypothetical protein IKJ24_05455, partial [Clostridia bacterium]|nr:hypothetical protein [Clostridia bacterium]